MSANGRKLFLGGLTKTTTTEHLFEIFGEFGTVVDAVVMERNGNPRGFGFVTFKDRSSLDAVLLNGVAIDGREIDIKRAVPEEEMAAAPSKVFVGGLSQKVDKNALKAHFEQYGEVRDAVVMIDRSTGRSRGFGFVRFSAPEAVNAVLQTPQQIAGQYVDVKRAEPADSLPPAKKPVQPGSRRSRRRGRDADEEPTRGSPGSPGSPTKNFNMAMWNLLSMPGGMPAAAGMPFPADFGGFPTGFPQTETPAARTVPMPAFAQGEKENPLLDVSNFLGRVGPWHKHNSVVGPSDPWKQDASAPPFGENAPNFLQPWSNAGY